MAMNNLPSAFWYSVSGLVFALLLPVVIVFIRNRGELKVRDVSLSLNHRAAMDPTIKRIAEYMTDRLDLIRQKLFAGYIRLQKDRGCPEELLTENEDSEFVQQMLGNIVWSGNGIKSIKSIFEKSLLDRSFIVLAFPVLVESLVSSIEQNAGSYINRNYRSHVHYTNGVVRERIVSSTEWMESLPVCMQEIKPVIENILAFARGQYQGGKL